MSAPREGVLGKANVGLAHVVHGMRVVYHDLREATGIKVAIPDLPVFRKALHPLGSSAYMAVHPLVSEYQKPETRLQRPSRAIAEAACRMRAAQLEEDHLRGPPTAD